ncbi:metallo-beta-lactamase L1 precursor [Variibacter gotjawalensis]|uniref:Metallo-beta-lactamase L1 n=1 Tax=Variibacter gotjawalensis TaxID=1333996 RepID=A0A0S3PX07_9BRAD|nr:subclass B3 metallo-beta-lactamase [Variibacter gotjawalensis]NIK46275.1 metallo-beta-lactamase class B [Variibacter gotjawalensis]RZS48190.1 metallo-beta-lactamase class B [Variibacter gotjawalensis]BAT60447.1 metallo-beta-lactamase L1 precursor [Variibacter gotjawalensis]
MKRAAAAFLFALGMTTVSAEAQTLKDLLDKLKANWNAPTEPFRVAGNIHYVGTAGLGSWLITSPQGHILIDTGLVEANSQIKANIEKLGFKLTDVKQLLNTHAHLDHAAGLAELKKESGAPLAASALDKPILEGGYYPGQEDEKALDFPAVKVDRVVGEGDKITVGDTTITAVMTPGHSPGCTSWMIPVKENGKDYTAFLFCSGTVALNKLVGKPTHPTIVEDYRKTFARARDIKADIFLAPHPEMFGMKEKREQIRDGAPNPFIKPGEFNTYAATMETAFEEALKKQTAALEKK